MKKVFSFLRSMRFGMILLTAIAALSIVGTLVVQGQSADYYAQAYEGASALILALGVDHIYSTWVYIALFAALCLNLLLCSILRVGKIRAAKAGLIMRAQTAKPAEALAAEAAAAALKKLGFREKDGVYTCRTFGLYGSFITHIGMLLLVIASACTFGLERKQDAFLMPGDTLPLSDGASVTVDAFSMEDDSGRLEYISDLTLTGADGQSRQATIMVNHPAKIDNHTIYQQSFAHVGVLDVQTAGDAKPEQILLDGPAFISLDGATGVQYHQLYGDYTEMEDGQVMPARTTGGAMVRPIYLTTIVRGESQEIGLTMPGETFEVGGVYYTFREPMAYPGLRVKTQPGWVLPLLYTSFAVLVAGLYFCFFHVPAAATIQGGAVRVVSGKDAQDVIDRIQDKIQDMKE